MDPDLEGGRRHCRYKSSRFGTKCYAWASFLFWTTIIFGLIFGIAFFAFVRSNLPDVKVHRLDVYKLNVTEPKDKNKDTQLTVDVKILVNVTNSNKKITLAYGKVNVETTIDGIISLPKVHVHGFRQHPMTTKDLKIYPQEMRSVVNEDDAKELKLSGEQHDIELNLKMNGKIQFWYNGMMISNLHLKVSCEGIQQSLIDQTLPHECNVKLGFFS